MYDNVIQQGYQFIDDATLKRNENISGQLDSFGIR